MLGDDIGWADFSYNGGIAATPNIDQFAAAPGSVRLMDFHSGGTVCSPTRASILTGRTHFRDCVNYVYDCSDMSEGVPLFEFAPRATFTIAHAMRLGLPTSESFFGGKWHLGSLFNDSESLGGITSSPRTHGFDRFNATVEVAPTATTNCEYLRIRTQHAPCYRLLTSVCPSLNSRRPVPRQLERIRRPRPLWQTHPLQRRAKPWRRRSAARLLLQLLVG